MLSISKCIKGTERCRVHPNTQNSLVCENNEDPGYFHPIRGSPYPIWHPHFVFPAMETTSPANSITGGFFLKVDCIG